MGFFSAWLPSILQFLGLIGLLAFILVAFGDFILHFVESIVVTSEASQGWFWKCWQWWKKIWKYIRWLLDRISIFSRPK